MKPRKPIKRMSAKRTSEARQYAKAKKVFLDTHPLCFKCGYFVPREWRQLHHWAGRVGELLIWVPGFRSSCADCHTWVEQHRNEAAELGFRAPNALFGRPSKVIPK